MITEKTNRELVNDGFAFAKNLNGDTPVMEIAKMIADLATRLDVATVCGNHLMAENEQLRKKVEALAAENAVMLRLLTDISENHVEYFSEGEDGMFAGVPLDYVSEVNTYVSRDVDAENPFTSTDAAIREIEARGVDKFADHWQKPAPYSRISEMARDYANKLRSGEVSNGESILPRLLTRNRGH